MLPAIGPCEHPLWVSSSRGTAARADDRIRLGAGTQRTSVSATNARVTSAAAERTFALMIRRALLAAAAVSLAAALPASASANYHQVGDVIPAALGIEPGALAVDQRHDDGPLAVIDVANQRIFEVTTLGQYVASFPISGCSLRPGGNPYDIAISPGSGNIYFSDSYYGRVFGCPPAGGSVGQYNAHVTPGDIGIIPQSADGKWLLVVAASDYDTTIETIDAGGNWHNWGESGDGPGQFDHVPDAMTVDPSRRLVYVSVDNDAYDNEKARIEKFTPSGTYLGEWSVTNAAGNGTPAFGLTVDPAGDVLAFVGRCIVKYGPGGRLLARFACDYPFGGAMATDRLGDVFVADQYAVHSYQAVYPHTTITSGPTAGEHWADPTPQFDFAASQLGARFACRVDADAWASCPTPFISSHIADGTHTISVRATDADGLTGPVTKTSLVIDTKPPNLRISTGTVTLTTGGVAKIRLTCPAPEASGPCGGLLFLKNVDPHATNQGLEYLLGLATFSVPSGDTKAVRIRLIAHDRAIIAKLGSIHAQATINVHDAVGNRTNGIAQAFTLNAP